MAPITNGKGYIFVEGDNQMNEDIINLTVHSTGDANNVQLTLASNVSWWKGIVEGQWEIVATQDDRKWASAKFAQNDINGRKLVLAKAKLFGVHTQMYGIGNDFANGYEYTFTWKKD